MRRQPSHVHKLATPVALIVLVGCQDFGPAGQPVADAGTTTTLMSCDGTKVNPDLVCSGGARNGSLCTMDCCYPAGIVAASAMFRTPSCGIGNLGYTFCTCPNGVYEWCSCVTPPDWPALPAGGDCFPKGTSAAPPAGINGASCSKEWTTCWTAEVAGNRGCICLRDATTGNLNLRCGSPGDWFLRVRGVTTAY